MTGYSKVAPTPVRVAFFGVMIGRQAGYLTTQELIVSDLLAKDPKYHVRAVSSSLNRYYRLLDMAAAIVRRHDAIDVAVLSVYGGPSVVVEQVVTWLCQRASIPIVLVLHGGSLPAFASQHAGWVESFLNRARIVLAPSQYLARSMQQHCRTKIRVVPNVLTEDDYVYHHRSSVAPRLLWMRSFHDIYNPLMALYVVATLKQKYPDIRLTMAGVDKGLLTSAKRICHDLGIESNVRFPGFLNPLAKQREAASADIFINTSRIDNMPVALVEAAAFGLPNVTTNVGGIPDLFEHERSALFVPGDAVDDMAQQIDRLIQTPSLCSLISGNAREVAERSFWANVKPLWDGIFAELAG